MVVAFGGIDSRVLEIPNGTSVSPTKQGYEIMVEVDKDRGFAGKFPRG